MFRLVLAFVFLALVCACTSPAVMPTRSEASFKVTQVANAKVAIWPVIASEMDESISQTVAREYVSRDKFLDEMSAKLSASLSSVIHRDSIKPEGVVAAFKAKDLREFLDPTPALTTSATESRFGLQNEALGGYLSRLREQAVLKDVQFAVIPVKITIGRKWTPSSGGPGVYSGGNNGGVFVSGESSSANSSATLRVVIIDLPKASVVWDGNVMAVAGSTFMKATALHEVESDLVSHFVNAIHGIDDRILTH